METFSFSRQARSVADVLHQVLGENTAFIFAYSSQDASQSVFDFSPCPCENGMHFYILAFSRKKGNGLAGSLCDLVEKRSDGQVTATFLLHDARSLRANSRSWFFDRVLRFGYRLSLDKTKIPYLDGGGFASRDVLSAKTYWHKCEAVAGFYLESAVQSERLDVELAKVSLLSQAVEYALLGLIRAFLDYTPNNCALAALFDLCGVFTNLPADTFQTRDKIGRECRRRLCAPYTMLRYWNRLEWSESQFTYLSERCSHFIEQASVLATARLARP